jgi:hypothetical protein
LEKLWHWKASLPGANGLMIDVHYVNTGSAPITGSASIQLTAAPPGAVIEHVGTIALYAMNIQVPPNTPATSPASASSSATPIASFDYDLLQSWSYMTHQGVDFTASAGGTTFYTQSQSSQPAPTLHRPYRAILAGTPIDWTCRFSNDTGQPLSFGDSALSNASCNFIAQYVPANPASPDVLVFAQ